MITSFEMRVVPTLPAKTLLIYLQLTASTSILVVKYNVYLHLKDWKFNAFKNRANERRTIGNREGCGAWANSPLFKVFCCVLCENASQLFSIFWISLEKWKFPFGVKSPKLVFLKILFGISTKARDGNLRYN